MSKTENKELIIFLLVSYGSVFFLGICSIILWQLLPSSMNSDRTWFFTSIQMFFPASGLILVNLLYRKSNLLPKKFFVGFLSLTGILVVYYVICLIIQKSMSTSIYYFILLAGNIFLFLLYFLEKKDHRIAYNLAGQNWSLSFLILFLFVAIFYIKFFFLSICSHDLSEFLSSFSATYFFRILTSIPSLLLCLFFSFFGEEYGWRCYFQPLLQKKFGLIKGILLFAFLWELWHLPTVIFTYLPSYSIENTSETIQFIFSRYASTLFNAVFIAYSYLKTKNLWAAVFVHCFSNILASIDTTGSTGNELTWSISIAWIFINIIFSVIFLFLIKFKNIHSETKASL